ncbi:hypothetical protein [Pacificoceanicola onchidii]|uniref:hypothetical protein n=1 Tax=Pacificoceanicola onchidii TaxID=2562685 RepID=UPI0010A5EF01|nr:hypothetical protein [Pacificoceanicola onchidii]
MTTIPGTRTKAVFMPVADGSFPPLYYGAGEGSVAIASMNAGNSQGLYVGGDGINKGFRHALSKQKTDLYASEHTAMAGAAAPGAIVTKTYTPEDPCACMTLCNKRLPGTSGYTGLAFADVFSDALCPHGNTMNRGMSYVAPPYGGDYTRDADFLDAIRELGGTAVEAVHGYNLWAKANSAPEIGGLRLCMYSSSIYNPKGVPQNDIAMAIYGGVRAGIIATGASLSEVQMPVASSGPTAHKPYFAAVKASLTS